MDAEGLGRKLLLTPLWRPPTTPEKQAVGTVTASQKMLTLLALASSLNASTAKRGCLVQGKAFGWPQAVCPPKRPRPLHIIEERPQIPESRPFRLIFFFQIQCLRSTVETFRGATEPNQLDPPLRPRPPDGLRGGRGQRGGSSWNVSVAPQKVSTLWINCSSDFESFWYWGA